jgi:hypothetical protein
MIENSNQYHSNLYALMESLGCLYKKKKDPVYSSSQPKTQDNESQEDTER